MPNYKAEITDSKITVGQNEGNHFSILITADSGDLTNVIVRVSIPCGPEKIEQATFLVDDAQGPRPNVNYLLPDNADTSMKIDPLPEGGQPAPPSGYLVWEIPSKGIVISAGTRMKIEVTGLAGNIPPGKANVIVGIRERGKVTDKPFTEKTLEVVAALKPGDEEGVKIHYFTASKDYVLHASEEEVILSWHTSSAVKTVTLFKNNVKIWPPYGGSDDLFVLDKPGITSVYRLEAMGDVPTSGDTDEGADREDLLVKGTLVVRTLTVQVAQAGWNRQPLPQGYPTALMKALSFKSGESERLYGVFVDPKGDAEPRIGLYSSATGFPPWRMEADGKDFRQIEVVDGQTYSLSEMSHSPGVAGDGKLWLIGGSSVNPSQTSNEVWYYWKNDTTRKEEWVRDKPGPFTPRMGHSVVAFMNRLWVLGGYDENRNPLNDVWSYDLDSKKWSGPAKASWPQRCMFTAAASPDTKQMWLYGGRISPNVTASLTDLWSTTDGVKWQRESTFELGPLPGRPNGATLFWDDGLHLAGSFNARTRGGNPPEADAGATLSAMVYSLCPDRFLWEANPVSFGWEQFGGDPFLMQSIVFNRFWFLWSLFQDIQTAPKLNIFIPS